MIKNIIISMGFFLLCSFTLLGQGGDPVKVGEEVELTYESAHPYAGTDVPEGKIVEKQEVYVPGATYVAVHFSKLELNQNDYLVISSPDETRTWKYDHSRNTTDESNAGVWSIPIYGDKLVIKVVSNNSTGAYGYYIDKIAKGIVNIELKSTTDGGDIIGDDDEAICGADNTLEAKCYYSSQPTVYNKSKAVARILINGTGACTAWLVGSEGHIMTNNHCVGSSSSASNTTVEFMAEGASCGTNCQTYFGCPGTIVATSTTLIKTDVNLDYSLLKLPTNVSSSYGYLQLRATGAVNGEQIYIPQHPSAWGKRIAFASDYSGDANDLAHVQTLTAPRCDGTGYDVGYYADTRGGSSGSPVLGYDDHLVVALHHCAYCPNRGVPIQEIITDLGSSLPDNAIGNCPVNLTITNNISGGTYDYMASNTITATNGISGGANVHYGANSGVKLNTGFKVSSGSIFKANLKGCLEVKNTEEGVMEESIAEESYDKESEIVLYPNPATSFVSLTMNNIDGEKHVQVYSTTGVLVEEISTSENELFIDTKKLLPGVYIINVLNGQEQYQERLIISKK